MPRIQGVDLPTNKPTHISLRYLRGIGPTTAFELCEKANIDPFRSAKELNDDDIARIATILDREFLVEGALRRTEASNIDRLRHIGCYRGMRHRRGLPCRGQRTKTNARTRKGKRKTVAGKKGVKDLK
ncbi:MAG: 30S ribosomal protein S13 [Zavarzinella sp.]